uniref:Zgc:152904 n=1 Tax=Cyprinus carpio TaxID=7962 RepID=A0A8C2KIM8_CYPCA
MFIIEDAEVVCDVISSPVPAVSWFYKNREITSEPNSRLQVLPSNNLQILRVSKADEGVYRCEARVEARGEIDFRDIVVLVNVPPVLSVPQQSFNATADYQESVTFTCITSGSPDPQVTWYWKGHVIERSEQYVLNTLDGGKSTLTIKNIRQGDGGPYTCRASNKAGSSESQLFLKVFVQPHITQLRNVTAVEGSAAMISCTAEGEPLPEISWRRASDGQTNVRLSDWGRFDCEALSRIGGHQKSMFLDIESSWCLCFFTDVPSHPYSVRLSAVSQRLATISFMKPDSHGGVPISYYIISYRDTSAQDWRTVRSHAVQMVLTHLEPNTTYEVRVAAVNGKGQGDFSHTETFQTLPIREPSPPTVHGQRGVGKAYRLGLIKQDDGGMPIVEYIVKYKTDKEEQWMTKLVPGVNDFALLQPLQWNTRYNVEITARNVKGLSEPTFFQFLMPQKPDITADSLFSGLGLGAVVGLSVAALLLLLVLVDISCFFLRQCGLLMCITRKLCSKKTSTSGKSKELEEGKAAYLVDGSKELIVEMRTEEERIANQEDSSPVHEPNETTPLTEPEKLPLKEENGKEVLKPDLIEIKVHTDNSIHTKQDDSKA